MVSTPTKELVKNDRGEIIGVIAECEGQEIFISAKKGVIMTCGGFENNQKMKSENLNPKKDIGLLGSPGNTGDGIKMVQLDETALQLTIGKYNHLCCNGVDSDFGRKPDTLKAIAPPYYAMQLMPLLYNTQGGPRRDKQARVLDPDGNLIPRLYAAGEFGSIWGFRYQTSTNVSECLVYGRIAGKNAAMSD
jgi:succinate dehydrogenase/fumarate reductase flavoprotein subunit